MIQDEQVKRYLDLSGGMNTAVSRFFQKENELLKAENADFDKEMGSVTRRDGFSKLIATQIEDGKDVDGVHPFVWASGSAYLAAVNATDGLTTVIRRWDGSAWQDVITGLPEDSRVDFENFLEGCFVVGYDPTDGTYATTTKIESDYTTTTTEDLLGAPKGRFIAKAGDAIYIGNVEVGGVRYSDRIYKSSTPLGVITVVNGNQSSVTTLQVSDARYLNVNQVIDIYTGGTSTKVVDSKTITAVDKRNNTITFTGAITVTDNDEIYGEDQRDNLRIYWYEKDYLRIPPRNAETPEVMGMLESSNRLLIWTRNSFWKWDNANLIQISAIAGLVAPDSLQRVGDDWILWTDGTNVWAYNEKVGQLQNISRQVKSYLVAAQAILDPQYWVGIATDDVYALYVGATSSGASTYYRLRYQFNMNDWSVDKIEKPVLSSANIIESNVQKAIWGDNDGWIYYFENDVNTDDGSTIPFTIESGRLDQGNPETWKTYNEIYIFTDKGQSATLYLSFDDGEWIAVEQIDGRTSQVKPKDPKFKGTTFQGHYYRYKISQNDSGDAVVIQGTSCFYTEKRQT